LKTKLAVLISGSYRNFDSTWRINEEILRRSRIPYEVFFHTWDINPNFESDVLISEYKNRFYLIPFPKRYSEFPQEICAEKIKQKYRFRSVEVSRFDEQEIARMFHLRNLDTNSLYRSQLNSCGMYLGIDAVSQKISGNSEFSHFLRIRTDFILDGTTFDEILMSDLVFYGQLLPTEEGLIGDQCFGGDLSKAGFILETLSTLNEITQGSEWIKQEPVILGENVIRQRLKPYRKDIKISYFNQSGNIARPRVILDLVAMSPSFIKSVFAHNIRVLIAKMLRFSARLSKK
jgi:hypothetical protein